ncbi:MAG: hypothetical protein HDR82_09855 [Bacteroides sp.]|nr:hypothetical protein [Bacteroides sp.]
MTKDELIALRRERSKQELNIGDKVIVHGISDKPLYDGKVATIIEKGIICNEVYYGLYIEGKVVDRCSVPNPLNPKSQAIGKTALLAPFYAEDLELVKQSTDEIKCGDRVETPYGVLIVDMIAGENIFGHYENGDAGIWIKKELNRRKIQPNDHTITIPVKADLDDTYWDAYRAELASKIAVAYAEKGRYKPSEIGEFAVMVANDVVDNLKKQIQ